MPSLPAASDENLMPFFVRVGIGLLVAVLSPTFGCSPQQLDVSSELMLQLMYVPAVRNLLV